MSASNGEEAALVGAVVLRDKKNRETRALLKSEIRRIAAEYSSLVRMLNNSPELIGFPNESVEARFNTTYRRVFDTCLFDEEKMRKLIAEYRETLKTQDELDESLMELGLRPRPIEIRRPA